MQKVDLVIAGVGAVALIATVLGIVLYEEAVGEQTVSFREVTREGAFASQTGAGTTHTFTWDVPDNATGGSFDVEVTATGTSLQGGQISVSVTITAPDGTSHPETGSVNFPQSVQDNTERVTVSISHSWFSVPAAVTTTDPGSVNVTKTWSEPVRIEVSITGPGNAVGDTISYGISAEGDAQVYERAPPELPDDPATA